MKIRLGVKYAALCAAMVISARGQNLLQNPGFEAWSGGMPNCWLRDDSIYVRQDNIRVHSGSFSARDSLVTQNQEVADLYQGPFAVSANTQYTFSVHVLDNDPAGRLRLIISWHSTAGWTNHFSTSYSGNSADWQQMTVTSLSPPGTDSALVSARAYDSSSAWDGHAVFNVDDASFTPATVQNPVVYRSWHKPTNPAASQAVQAYSVVYDDGTIIGDTLCYGINGLSVLYRITHTAVSGDTFRYQIPGRPAGDTVRYFIKFVDDDGLPACSDTGGYLSGTVNVRINEVYYDPPGEDSGSFIELRGPAGYPMARMSLVGVNGTNGADYALIALDQHAIPADGFFVCAQNPWVPNADTVTSEADLQNGPDNLELRCGSVTVDALGYGSPDQFIFTGEWLPARDVASGHCLGRYPDGHDTDHNGLDFVDYDTITPGLPNAAVRIDEASAFDLPGTKRTASFICRGPVVLGSLLNGQAGLPAGIYDCLGRLVKIASEPDESIDLKAGVHFVAFRSRPGFVLKLVVIR